MLKESFTWEALFALLSFCVSIIVLLYTLFKDKMDREREDKQQKKNEELSNQTYSLTQKINSKEYQIFEDLKESLMQVIASVRSIDAIAALYIDLENIGIKPKRDFSLEIEIMKKLQTSPSYLIFLHSIEDNKARKEIEASFRNFSDKIYLMNNSRIRKNTHLLMKLINENINENLINNEEVYNLMKEFCTMEGVFTNFNFDELLKIEKEVNEFIKYLEKNNIKGVEVSYSDKGIVTNKEDVYEQFKNS